MPRIKSRALGLLYLFEDGYNLYPSLRNNGEIDKGHYRKVRAEKRLLSLANEFNFETYQEFYTHFMEKNEYNPRIGYLVVV